MNLLSEADQKHVADLGDGLYIGSWLSTKPEIIKALQIRVVMSIGAPPVKEIPNVQYVSVKLQDNPNDASVLLRIIPTVTMYVRRNQLDLNHKVLIHCSTGKNCSPALAVAYLMRFRKMSLKDAHALVKSMRPAVNISPEFGEALEYYASILL